jgi:hypothetical protein
VVLGAPRVRIQGSCRESRDLCFCFEIDPVDGPFALSLFEMNLCFRMNTLNRKTCLGQLKQQCYRKTSGVGGAQQFVRTGALPSSMRELKS